MNGMMPLPFTGPPSAEQLAAMRAEQIRLHRVEAKLVAENHQRLCRFAAFMCTCGGGSPWFTGISLDNMHACPVHGTFLVISEEFL